MAKTGSVDAWRITSFAPGRTDTREFFTREEMLERVKFLQRLAGFGLLTFKVFHSPLVWTEQSEDSGLL